MKKRICKIFIVVMMAMLLCITTVSFVACDSKDDIKRDWAVQTYVEQQKEINSANYYSNNLADSKTQILEGETLNNARMDSEFGKIAVDNEADLAKDGKYVVYKKRTATYGTDDLTLWGANDNITFAGALLKINNSGDKLSPIIGLKRKPMTLSLGIEGATGIEYQVKTIDKITQSYVGQAINELVKGATLETAQLPYTVAMQLTEIKAEEELDVAFGVSSNFKKFFNLSHEFDFKNRGKRTYAVLTLKQIYFTVNVDYDSQDGVFSLIDDSITIEDMKKACPEDYCPTYVSSVSYGRIAAITIKTTDTFDQLSTKLSGGGGVGSFGANLESQLSYLNSSSSIEYNCFVYGGSVEGQQAVLSGGNINDMISTLNHPYDPKKQVGVPISYQLSHISDNSSAKIGFSSDYYYAEIVDSIKAGMDTQCHAEFPGEYRVDAYYGNYDGYGAGYIANNYKFVVDLSKLDLDYIAAQEKNILLEIELYIKEKNDGYQEIYVYNGNVDKYMVAKGKVKPVAQLEIEHNVGNLDTTYKKYVLRAVISPGVIERNALWIAFDAHGKDNDTWFAKDIKVSLSMTSEKEYPLGDVTNKYQ